MIQTAFTTGAGYATRATRAAGEPGDSFQPGSSEPRPVNAAMLNALCTGTLTDDDLVAWKVQLPGGLVRDDPTFGSGTVYIPQSGGTTLLNLEDGKVLKHHSFDGPCEARAAMTPEGDLILPSQGVTRYRPDMSVVWNQPDVPYSSNPPLLAPDGGAYLSSYSPTGNVVRVDGQGQVLWNQPVRREHGDHMDTGMSFSRDGKQIYAGGEGILYALNAESGEILWGQGKAHSTVQVGCTPLVTGRDEVVVSGGNNQVTCFDRNGKEVWKWSAAFEKRADELTRKQREEAFGWGNGLIESNPVLTRDGKTILVAGDEKLLALDLDGNLQWKKDLPGATMLRDQAIQIGPEGNIYVKSDHQTQAWAFNEQGDPLWHYENRSPSGSAFMGVNNDTVVFVTREGSCVALRKDAINKRIAEIQAKPDEAPTQIQVGNGVVTIGGVRLKAKR